MIKWDRQPVSDYVLANGSEFAPARPGRHILHGLTKQVGPRLGHCFKVSMLFARSNPWATYCEGFAGRTRLNWERARLHPQKDRGITPHAWIGLVDYPGFCLDLCWDWRRWRNMDKATYIGITFDPMVAIYITARQYKYRGPREGGYSVLTCPDFLAGWTPSREEAEAELDNLLVKC